MLWIACYPSRATRVLGWQVGPALLPHQTLFMFFISSDPAGLSHFPRSLLVAGLGGEWRVSRDGFRVPQGGWEALLK